LKNIFRKVLKDEKIWLEIERMFEFGILNISNENIYQNFDVFSFNSLSYFLFNIYLSELDFYVYSLINQFNFKCCFFVNSLPSSNHSFFVFPIKLKSNKFINSRLNFPKCSVQFESKIYYVRYLDCLFLGLTFLKTFVVKFNNRLITFLKGNLFLDMDYCKIFLSTEKKIIFIGYNICFSKSNLKIKSSPSLTLLTKKMLSKIFYKKIKYSKLFLSRFYYEFIDIIQNSVLQKKGDFIDFQSKKTWLYVFQLEALHSINEKSLNSTNLITPLKNVNNFFLLNLKNYSFNLFLTFLNRSLKEKNSSTSFIKLNNFLIPSDGFLKFLLRDFSTKYFFLFSRLSFSFETRKFFLRSYLKGRDIKFFTNYLFFNNDILNFSLIYSKTFKNFSLLLDIKIPLSKLYQKLDFLGFLNFLTRSSCPNMSYIFLEDFLIIYFFQFFSYSIFSWYRISPVLEFEKLSSLFLIIQESCFLTLSRKHKKSRNWSHEVYNFNFLFFEKSDSLLLFNKSFYKSLNKNINNLLLIFDESFFLNL
jgi:hypothetical protein